MTDIAQIRRVLEGLRDTLNETINLCYKNSEPRYRDVIVLIKGISFRCRNETMALLDDIDAFDAAVQILKQVNKEVDDESEEGSELQAQDDAGAED